MGYCLTSANKANSLGQSKASLLLVLPADDLQREAMRQVAAA